jgi:hypothetical protein
MIGAYWAESMQLAETGKCVGAMHIWHGQTSQIPFLVPQTTASSARDPPETDERGATLRARRPGLRKDNRRHTRQVGALLTTALTAAGNHSLQ